VRNAHGVLGAGQRKAVLEDTFAQVIGPALDALRASVTADPGLRA
jgi:hypothetical protein